MLVYSYFSSNEPHDIEFGDMPGVVLIEPQSEDLVEVAIIQLPVPSDADHIFAHEAAQGPTIERSLQFRLVFFEGVVFDQNVPKTSYGHICRHIKAVERYPEAPLQFPFVIVFQPALRRRQESAGRVEDKTESLFAGALPVTETVQCPERLYALLKSSPASHGVDPGFGIAGKRCYDLYGVPGVKFRETVQGVLEEEK